MSEDLKLNMNDYLPLRDVVFHTLREAILKGSLKPGERLMELQLAAKLGVSRTPIREAIRMLEQEGLAITIPRKGAEVAKMTEKDMEDVLYGQLSGRVARHYPLIGGVMTLYTSKIGKAYVICFAACGAMFNILAGRIRARRKEKLAGSQQAP